MKKNGNGVGVRDGEKDGGFAYGGAERGGIKGSKKGIKFSHSGRHLHETEHHKRMGHEVSEHPSNPGQDGGIY